MPAVDNRRPATWLDVLAPPAAHRAPAAPNTRRDSSTSSWRVPVGEAMRATGASPEEVTRLLDAIAEHAAGLTLYVGRRNPARCAVRDEQIRAQAAQGIPLRTVARAHGVSLTQARRIVGKTPPPRPSSP